MMIGRALKNAVRRARGIPTFEKSYGIWSGYIRDALQLAGAYDVSLKDLAEPQQRPELLHPDRSQRVCNWYVPVFDHPFFGGLMTVFRIAAHLLEIDGVRQRFVICGPADPENIRRQIARAFPSLVSAEIVILDSAKAIAEIPPADYSVASLWTTAFVLLRVHNTALKFYMIQDFEPLFYPAGSTAAQAELTYRFGYLGIGNSIEMKRIYERDYQGVAHALTPQIDPAVFYPPSDVRPTSPLRIFWYARPSTPRNGFELAAGALRLLKARFGDAIDIVCAGSGWNPADFGLTGIVRSVGLLSYAETGDLYRTCHVALLLSMTRHPSYLPLELMACGCLAIVNTNPATAWLLEHERNCLISPPAVSALAETLARAVTDYAALKPIRDRAAADALARSSWKSELAAVAAFMASPPVGDSPRL